MREDQVGGHKDHAAGDGRARNARRQRPQGLLARQAEALRHVLVVQLVIPPPQEWSEPLQSSDEEVYAAPRHELSLFQAYRETNADDGNDWNYEPAPSSSSRWYIGAVLFLLILGLGYMAWKGMQNSQTSRGVSASTILPNRAGAGARRPTSSATRVASSP